MSTEEDFARLERSTFGQILATIQKDETSEGEEGPTVRVRLAERHGMVPEITMGPWDDTDEGWIQAQKFFEEADLQKTAEDMAKMIDAMFAAGG